LEDHPVQRKRWRELRHEDAGRNDPGTCGTRGVISTLYAVNGIQNGSPDGMALVDAANNVIQFLSYEGTFTAADGPAAGMVSVDIGVAEAGTEALGLSLQLDGAGVWHAPAASTFAACNDNDVIVVGPLAKITVTPATATITNGATQQFTATGADAAGESGHRDDHVGEQRDHRRHDRRRDGAGHRKGCRRRDDFRDVGRDRRHSDVARDRRIATSSGIRALERDPLRQHRHRCRRGYRS
jgi:hypothetical protein